MIELQLQSVQRPDEHIKVVHDQMENLYKTLVSQITKLQPFRFVVIGSQPNANTSGVLIDHSSELK